jgi:hypothetical protein
MSETRIVQSRLYELEEVKKYWNLSLPETLAEDETIRIVKQVREADGTYGQYGILTEKIPFRKAEDVTNFLDELQNQNPNKQVGVSMSTAVFNYTGETPKIDAFKYSNTIAIDIDTHMNNGKERYVLGYLDKNQIQMSIIKTWNEINNKTEEFGIGSILPIATILTGGGLQFIIAFERTLNRSEAQKLYGLLKNAIGNLKWKTVLGDTLGNYTSVAFDIDKSFADLAHVQRVAGTVNQKYDVPSRIIPLFELSRDEQQSLREELKNGIDDTNYTDQQKEIYKKSIDEDFELFFKYLNSAAPIMNVEDNLITAKMQSARTSIRPSELKGIEYELLQKLKKENVSALDLLSGDVRLGITTGNLTKLYCPFHEESNPSMAFYQNELFDVFKDFHDDKSYSLVSFWEKLYNVSKSTAIAQIADRAGLALGKGERKDFQNLELSEIVDELIKRIDTENFVYYRLANKNRTCIVRHIDSGEAFIFDGPKMLANHILSNQLDVYDAEQVLVEEFGKRFMEIVLVDAFEEFYPGRDTVFNKQFIKFVNLWVPSNRYQRVHARAAEIDIDKPFSLEEAIALIKRKAPWTYKYILQMVQNGDLTWFINWLSGVSKFKTMPVVPVIFGVPGAGKNLFVNTIMDFYLNNEYVKVVSGDRIMQQFNSMLESSSLIVLDEGDFSTGKEVDQLKLLTGNDKILIEKKGVDATNKQRHFNILFFSNGEVPLRHPAQDRRISYFHNEIPLLASCESWGITIDDMVERVRSEMVEFWAIMVRTELDHKMAMANSKNGQFWKQILMQHPFGALIVKLMNGEWEDIALQLNENVSDQAEMGVNLKLLLNIKDQFETNGRISLTLINRYLQSLNFRMKQSIQKFIQVNHLPEFGISIIVEENDVKINVNKKKVQEALRVKNVLRAAYPKTAREEVSILEAELAQENADTGIEVEDEIETLNNLVAPPAPDID